MQHIRRTGTELWRGNFANSLQTSLAAASAWLITLCPEGGDGLTSQMCLRLSGLLDGLGDVGKMDCATQDNLVQGLLFCS